MTTFAFSPMCWILWFWLFIGTVGAFWTGCASIENPADPNSTFFQRSTEKETDGTADTESQTQGETQTEVASSSTVDTETTPETHDDTLSTWASDSESQTPSFTNTVDTSLDTTSETGVDTEPNTSSGSTAPTDNDTSISTEEPDTDFVCSNTLECSLKWFGTLCCDKRCINPATNVKHCGACNNDCMADRRGNSCAFATCTCGPVPMVGCQGEAAGDCCTNLLLLWACNAC